MQALASERPLAREAGWDQKPSGESRLGYDGNEGIYFDRTKAADEIGEDGQPLFEECDPEEVCAELEKQSATLRTRLKQAIKHIDAMTAAVMDQKTQPTRPASLQSGANNSPQKANFPSAPESPADDDEAAESYHPLASAQPAFDDVGAHQITDASACTRVTTIYPPKTSFREPR